MKPFLFSRTILVAIGMIWSVTSLAQTADLILTNGKIVTVDDQFHIVQSLAIKNQRIMALGSTADLEKLKGPTTQ